MRKLAFVVWCALLASCATTPVPTGETKAAFLVLDAPLTISRPGTGKVTIKGDDGFFMVCGFRIFVNAKPLAVIKRGEAITAYLDPGEYVIGVQQDEKMWCWSGVVESAVMIKAGDVRTYRVSVDESQVIRFGPTAY
jgi:hypothetical protein